MFYLNKVSVAIKLSWKSTFCIYMNLDFCSYLRSIKELVIFLSKMNCFIVCTCCFVFLTVVLYNGVDGFLVPHKRTPNIKRIICSIKADLSNGVENVSIITRLNTFRQLSVYRSSYHWLFLWKRCHLLWWIERCHKRFLKQLITT